MCNDLRTRTYAQLHKHTGINNNVLPIRHVFYQYYLLFNSLQPFTTIYHLTTAAVTAAPALPVRERHSMTSRHGRLRVYFRAATAGVCVGTREHPPVTRARSLRIFLRSHLLSQVLPFRPAV